MTWNTLLKRIERMSPEQRAQKVKLYEGCSGNWDSLTGVYVAREDLYREGEQPGSEHENELKALYASVGAKPYKSTPAAKKGQVYIQHDH